MLPFFTYPLAFWGFLALPVLVAIYWLRTRHRRQPVSSLMLWLDPNESPQSGTRLDRLRTPLLFFLELLALTLLVLAAADPHVPLRQSVRPLLVVLDDSFSMQAGGEQSPRNQAARALAEELKRRPRPSIRFFLAGENAQALGETAHTTPEALDRLRDWRCRASSAQLQETLAFASELGGELPLLLVLTDHAPPHELPRGRVQWWAFGQPRANLALVNAVRTPHEGGERCLLEIANYSDEPREPVLIIETGEPPAPLQRSAVRLRPRQTRRVIVPLKERTTLLRARLEHDDLAIDNQVSLLPVAVKPIRTDVRIEDKTLRELIDRALRATGHALPDKKEPDLVVTDQAEPPEDRGDAWVVHVLVEKNAVSYTGPFVLDRNHPLTEGLSLQGVVWGAGKSRTLPGSPVLLAGDVPLLTDAEMPAGAHTLHVRLRPDLSTLPDAPAWPVLVWNLLRWRTEQKPGLKRANLRLGEQAELSFATPRERVTLLRPDGTRQTVPVQDRRLIVRGDDVGFWSIEAAEESASFAVNALSPAESDLSGCISRRWGDWLDETSLRLEYQSIAWILLLLILAIAAVHLVLVARGPGRSRPC
jgi:hypothetical protein